MAAKKIKRERRMINAAEAFFKFTQRYGVRVSKHASPVRQREFAVCPECRVTLSAGECVNRMCQISIHNYSLLPDEELNAP